MGTRVKDWTTNSITEVLNSDYHIIDRSANDSASRVSHADMMRRLSMPSKDDFPLMRRIYLHDDRAVDDPIRDISWQMSIAGPLTDDSIVGIYSDVSANPRPVSLMKSTDQGKTWTKVSDVHLDAAGNSGGQYGGYQNGILHCWFLDTVGTGYRSSSDDGETWNAVTRIAADVTTGGQWRPTQQAVVMDDGTLVMCFYVSGPPPYKLAISKSADNGITWTEPNDNIVYNSAVSGLALTEWHIADLGSDRWLGMCRNQNSVAGNNSIYQIESADGGATWGDPAEAIPAKGPFTSWPSEPDAINHATPTLVMDGSVVELWDCDRTDMAWYIYRQDIADIWNTPTGWTNKRRIHKYHPGSTFTTTGYNSYATFDDGITVVFFRSGIAGQGLMQIGQLARRPTALDIATSPYKFMAVDGWSQYQTIGDTQVPVDWVAEAGDVSNWVTIATLHLAYISTTPTYNALADMVVRNNFQPLKIHAIIEGTGSNSGNYLARVAFYSQTSQTIESHANWQVTMLGDQFTTRAIFKEFYEDFPQAENIYRILLQVKATGIGDTIDAGSMVRLLVGSL